MSATPEDAETPDIDADDEAELTREDGGTKMRVEPDGNIEASWIKAATKYIVRLPVCETFIVGPTDQSGEIEFAEGFANEEVIVKRVPEGYL